jgi:hypothetical protein
MRKRNLLSGICCFLLAGWLNVSQADDGLILGFKASDEITLVSATSTARVPAPRSIVGPIWSLAATSKDGGARWIRALTAPRQFHGDPDSAVSFSAVVPAIQSGDLLSMTDAEGVLRWSHVVDTAMLVGAAQAKRSIEGKLNAAYSATSKLQQGTSSAGLTIPSEPEQVSIPVLADKLISPRTPSAAASAKAAAIPTFHVGGTVATNNIDVRVFDASTGVFVVSERADWRNSRFDFDLPRGTYVFEVDDNRLRIDSPFFYRKPYRTDAVRITANTELPVIPQYQESGRVEITAQVPCTVVAQTSTYSGSPVAYFTATIVTEDGTRLERVDRVSFVAADPNTGAEFCPVIYGFQLSPGRYTLELAIPGWEAMRFDNLQVVDGTVVRSERWMPLSERNLVWTGTIVDATNTPLNAIIVNVIRETDQPYPANFLVDPSGSFEISYSRGWTIEFEPTWLSGRESSIRQRYVLASGTPPAKVVLPDIAVDNAMDLGLLRIYGDGNRDNHYNLLFLADGYTDLQESFTDTNGNGRWDAYVWYDMNGNGVFDGFDRYDRYGQPDPLNLELPDPSTGNEPFTDLNNDGMLNINEPAEFERNARDFVRSFLGSDFWHEHRTSFNAYVLFEPSEQSGFDVTTESGQVAVERATNYDANLVFPRSIMEVNRQAAMDRALLAMPDVDMVVVLVNQNVFTLARGNVTLGQPGVMVWPSGSQYPSVIDTGPAHEMGHYVAALCDEYSEFSGVSPLHGNPSNGCPNTSYLNDPNQVPWSNWILPGAGSPTRNMDGSVGVYEGANYYEGGAYRPSFDSLMRGLYPLFNAPSRAALETAVHARTGEWRDEVDDSGRCGRLPPSAIRRHGAACH